MLCMYSMRGQVFYRTSRSSHVISSTNEHFFVARYNMLLICVYTSMYHSCLIGHGIYTGAMRGLPDRSHTAFFFVCREMFR
jgi:hypothetical protein